jgi:hypothetical protein
MIFSAVVFYFAWAGISHREIHVDHDINVDLQSKPRNKCKYSIH